ncbi:MAG TPA: hypothetical protein VD906_10935 [Caulobacteraceae bacterium]|nr:hypothetical protein [Caulobacteraceae bacterium]
MLAQGDQPGLLGAVLIALAGGWAASRLMRTALDPFPSLIVGVCGAVLGMMLLGPLGLPLGALWLLAFSLAGGLLILALWRAWPQAAEMWRNRNHVRREEFEKRGSTGRSQEETNGLDYRHHHRHHRRVARREDHAP